MVFTVTHNNKSKIHTYSSVIFPILLIAINRYIFICHDKYSNVILATPPKNSSSGAMGVEYNNIFTSLTKG